MAPLTRMTSSIFKISLELPLKILEFPFLMSAGLLDALLSDRATTKAIRQKRSSNPGTRRPTSRVAVVQRTSRAA